VSRPREATYDAPLVRRTVPVSLDGLVQRITCYDAGGTGGGGSRETASFVVPILLSFGDPFRIAFDRRPDSSERIGRHQLTPTQRSEFSSFTVRPRRPAACAGSFARPDRLAAELSPAAALR